MKEAESLHYEYISDFSPDKHPKQHADKQYDWMNNAISQVKNQLQDGLGKQTRVVYKVNHEVARFLQVL